MYKMSQLKKKKVMFDSLFDPEVHDSLLARQAHEIEYSMMIILFFV